MASAKISLKLLVDNKAKKVLFAEAGKEFVDIVFSVLTLPIGAVANLFTAGTRNGSIGRLYQSVDHMDASYLQPGFDKKDLLEPKVLQPPAGGCELQLLLLQGCGDQCVSTVRLEAKAECPQCQNAMATEMTVLLPSSSSARGAGGAEEIGGFVKAVVTYMVSDGLEVTPMSAVSSVTMINKFSFGKDVELAEKHFTVGVDEGSALIKAALCSDTVLTDVFLAGKM